MADRQIFNTLIDFFEDDHWDFQWIEDDSVLSMEFSGINGKWSCYAHAREKEEQVAFYSVLSVNVPPQKRHKVAEFITRVNYGIIIGNFEMDYNDGEVRYKTSIDVEGSQLNSAMIRQIVYANLVITDRYLPGIMRVIYSKESPERVLESIELDDFFDDLFGNDTSLLFDDDNFNDDDDFPSMNAPPHINGGSPN